MLLLHLRRSSIVVPLNAPSAVLCFCAPWWQRTKCTISGPPMPINTSLFVLVVVFFAKELHIGNNSDSLLSAHAVASLGGHRLFRSWLSLLNNVMNICSVKLDK